MTSALAPGFRFHPTDEELVSYYLKRKLAGRAIAVDAIAEVDLYKLEPWELPGLSRIRSRDLEWYFFSCLDRKYSNRSRTNRATAQGYWKTTGKDRAVKHGAKVVGMKKTLVFHAGRAPRGQRTNWVMHEYRLEDGSDAMQMQQDGYVVCRVFQKNGAGPQNGAQYGAPFVEEEWEEEGEEAADGMVLMPGVVEEDGIRREEEVVEAGEATSVLVEGDGVGGRRQLDVDAVLKVNPSVQDIDSFDGDGCACLGGVHEELLSTNEVQGFSSELGLNSHMFTEDTKSVIIDGSQSCPSRDDEYLEMNDLFSPVKFENSLWTSNNHCIVDGVDDNFLDDVFHVENIIGDSVQHSGQPELTQISQFQDDSTMPSNDFVNSFNGPSSLKEEDLTFYDAPSHLVFAQNTDRPIESHSVVGEPSSYETFDDLMSYFDANDDLQYQTTGYSDCSDYFDSNIWDHSSEEVNDPIMKMPFEVLASSVAANVPSSSLHASHWQYENNYGSFTIAPDPQRNDDAEKTVSKSLVNILGSINAPPAFAAEFPSITGKSVGDVSASNSGSAVHIAAGLIEVHGLLLSYPEEIHKAVGFEPIMKDQYGVLAVLRGGFCLFFLSALTLIISCKVGVCIYGR